MDGIQKPRKIHGISKKPQPQKVESFYAIPKESGEISPRKQHSLKTSSTTQKSQTKRKNPTQKSSWKKIFISLLFVIIAVLMFGMGFILWKATQTTNAITNSNLTIVQTARDILPSFVIHSSETLPLQGQKEGRINILLLGKAAKNYPGQNLTDTIMIASIDTKENRASLLSLPRDMHVQIANSTNYAKINSLYFLGRNEENQIDTVKETIEEITNLTLHYWVVVDYEGFIQFVDALGGITVEVERDIYDTRFPGPNYSYETFELKKGWHTLDGATALKYVRERHSDPQGDFGRAHRQQKALQAIKNKAFSLGTFLNLFTFNELLGALEHNIKTNIQLNEIEGFIALAKKVDTQNINNVVIDAWRRESLLRVSHVYLDNGQRMFALVPRAGNYSEIQETAKNIFTRNATKDRLLFIENESASIALLNYSGDPKLSGKVRSLLGDLGFSTIHTFAKQTSQNLETTFLLDFTHKKKPYSLDEIIKRVPAQLSQDSYESYLPKPEKSDKYDLILLLGKDIIETYNWEEASWEEYKNTDIQEEY